MRGSALANQHELPLLFYDESLTHQLTKVVPFHNQEDATQILHTAERLLQRIPQDQLNFAVAKAAVMQATPL